MVIGTTPAVAWAADPAAGARAFRACAACHSLEAGQHMTGPSLAGLWERRAGTVEGFTRYSPALKQADVVWNQETLDKWLANPRAFLPRNRMVFAGIENPKTRGDLIAYLRTATAKAPAGPARVAPEVLEDLKSAGPAQRITAIRHCRDTYDVTTADGETQVFWEFNLRFKTDSSEKGPPRGSPALARVGMAGDRASAVFADPAEISAFIARGC
jgi:cytochrome c